MQRATKTLVLLFSLLLLLAGSAFADTADFQINVPNSGLGVNYAPGTLFATVHLSLVGNTIQATVTMEPTFKVFDAFGFNGVAGLTVSNLTPGWTSDGSGQVDGFGNFAYVLNGPNQGFNGNTVLSFTVNCPGGCSSVNQMVGLASHPSAGQEGAHFAMHVYPLNFTVNTGFAGDGAPVPEPASLALLGMGLAGLGGWFRKRKS